MLSGYAPFQGWKENVLKEKITGGIFHLNHGSFQKVSIESKIFLNKLISVNPKKRLTAEEALKSNYLKEEMSLSEHHQAPAYFKNIKDNLYAMIDDIDSDEDSEIIDESDDDGSDLEDFIVPDDEVDGMVIPPPNNATIDKEWNDWEPRSPGSLHFKEIVNVIETHAKIQADELNF